MNNSLRHFSVASFPVLHRSYRRALAVALFVLQATIAAVEDWERG